jgi:flagellar hook-length control protein FliK
MIGGVPTSIANLLGATPTLATPGNGAPPSFDFDAMLAMLGIGSATDAQLDIPEGQVPVLTGEDAPAEGEGKGEKFDTETLTAALDAGIGAVLALLAQKGDTPTPNTDAAAKALANALAVPGQTSPVPTVAQEIEQAIPQGLQVALAAVTRALTANNAPGKATEAPAGTAPLPSLDAQAAAEPIPVADTSAPASDMTAPAPAPVTPSLTAAATFASAILPPTPANDSAAPAPQAPSSDLLITHHLKVEQDGQWLDQLARDIARTAAHDSQLRFKLNPEHLGALTVEVSHRAEGAAVRFTADNETARTLIVDAQPKLMAEARAQGLRIAEAHVDLGAQGNGAGQGQPQRWFEDQKPFLRTHGLNGEMPADSPGTPDDGRYA